MEILQPYTKTSIYRSQILLEDVSRPVSHLWLSKGQSQSLIARFMGPTWVPPGADRTQVCPMWAHENCYLGWYTAVDGNKPWSLKSIKVICSITIKLLYYTNTLHLVQLGFIMTCHWDIIFISKTISISISNREKPPSSKELRKPRIWCCHYLPPGSLLTLGASESISHSHVSFNLI